MSHLPTLVVLLVCLSVAKLSFAQGCTLDCGANGWCRTGSEGQFCLCDVDYTGDRCESQIDNCMGVTCYNGGTCVDGRDAFTCSCAGGWIGDNCEINKDDCNPTNQCVEGVCVDEINGYHCTCSVGFEGHYCNINIDDCVGHQCRNGECVDGIASYTCSCSLGYTGDYCETNINDCVGNQCDHGTCNDGIGDYTCTCDSGWTGRYCDGNINECASGPCVNGACIDRINRYTCTCDAGWTGVHCDINPDDCRNNQCANGAQCVDGDGDYTCTCLSGWSGRLCTMSEYFSCASNNPCNPLLTRYRYHYRHTNPRKFVQCDDHGSCFEMDCSPGTIWGDSDRVCVRDPAYVRNADPCAGVNCNHGWCSNGNCVCNYGYTGDNCNQANVRPTRNTGVYSCPDNSPCSPLRNSGQYYYTHVDSNKFVQCSDHGQCWNMPCGSGTEWSITKYACAIPDN